MIGNTKAIEGTQAGVLEKTEKEVVREKSEKLTYAEIVKQKVQKCEAKTPSVVQVSETAKTWKGQGSDSQRDEDGWTVVSGKFVPKQIAPPSVIIQRQDQKSQNVPQNVSQKVSQKMNRDQRLVELQHAQNASRKMKFPEPPTDQLTAYEEDKETVEVPKSVFTQMKEGVQKTVATVQKQFKKLTGTKTEILPSYMPTKNIRRNAPKHAKPKAGQKLNCMMVFGILLGLLSLGVFLVFWFQGCDESNALQRDIFLFSSKNNQEKDAAKKHISKQYRQSFYRGRAKVRNVKWSYDFQYPNGEVEKFENQKGTFIFAGGSTSKCEDGVDICFCLYPKEKNIEFCFTEGTKRTFKDNMWKYSPSVIEKVPALYIKQDNREKDTGGKQLNGILDEFFKNGQYMKEYMAKGAAVHGEYKPATTSSKKSGGTDSGLLSADLVNFGRIFFG